MRRSFHIPNSRWYSKIVRKRIIGMWTRIEVCQILGKGSQSSPYWKKKFPRDICGPGRDWQKFKQLPEARLCGLKCGPKFEKQLEREKSKKEQTKPKLDNARRLTGIYFIDPEDGEYQKRKEKVGISNGGGNALQERNKEAVQLSGNWSEELWIQQDSQNKACMYREGARVHETTFGIISIETSWRTHRRQRIQLDDTLQVGSQVYSDASSDEIPDAKVQWTRIGRSSRQSQHGNWRKSREKRRLFSQHKETKSESTFSHWWTYVTSRTRIWNHN